MRGHGMRNLNERQENLTGFILLILMVASLLMLTMVSKGQDASTAQPPEPERAGSRSIKVCHRVIEHPNVTYELIIDRSDLSVHLDHGDYLGVCKDEMQNCFDIRIAPNPYYEKTEIMYLLTEASDVEVIIYDQIGNKIVTLVDEYQVPGSYSIEFNGKNTCYAPGIHVLKFTRITNEVSSVVFKRLMEIH